MYILFNDNLHLYKKYVTQLWGTGIEMLKQSDENVFSPKAYRDEFVIVGDNCETSIY